MATNPPRGDDGNSTSGDGNPSVWDQLDDLPDLADKPVDASWMPRGTTPAPPSTRLPPEPVLPRQVDKRKFRIPAGAGASGPPPIAEQPAAEPHPYLQPEPVDPDAHPYAPYTPGLPHPDELEKPRRRRRWPAVLLVILLLALVAVGVGAYRTNETWQSIERVPMNDVLSPASDGFRNYLIVGTDSRAGIDEDLDSSDSIGLGVSGNRSDTMVLLQKSDAGNTMMAIPRDLYVAIPELGSDRINTATFFGGPELLVQTVQQSLGVPVHHYMEVDLAGFLDVVDALGGVTIDFPCPVTDPKSGLAIDTAGPQLLDAEQALAYVRARTYIETCPGQESTVDGRADLGRVERQQLFLNAVFAEVTSTRNPLTLLEVMGGVADGMLIDDQLSFRTAFSLARSIGSNPPATAVLPTTPFTTSGGAQVLDLGTGAQTVLDGFR